MRARTCRFAAIVLSFSLPATLTFGAVGEIHSGVTISDDQGNHAGDAAFSGLRGVHLVVWRQTIDGSDGPVSRIMGALVKRDGEAQPSFEIGPDAANDAEPKVAYDGRKTEWIVVWTGSGEAGLGTIHARRVSGDGVTLGTVPLNLGFGRRPDVSPGRAIGFNTISRHLIVWEDHKSGASRLEGQFVGPLDAFASGFIAADPAFPISLESLPAEFAYIRPRTADGGPLVVASDGARRTMHQIVYSVEGPDSSAIVVTRVLNDEIVHEPVVGSRRTLERPVIALNPNSNRSLVVFEQPSSDGSGKELMATYFEPFAMGKIGPEFPLATAEHAALISSSEESFLFSCVGPDGVVTGRITGMHIESVLDEPLPLVEQPFLSGIESNPPLVGFRSQLATISQVQGVIFTVPGELPPNSPPAVDAGEDIAVEAGARLELTATAGDDNGEPLAFRWCEITEARLECLQPATFNDGSFSVVMPIDAAGSVRRFEVCADDLRTEPAFSSCDVVEVTVTASTPKMTFRRGECNADGDIDISDAVFTLGFLFLGEEQPGCLDACDSNDDGSLDISDAIATLGILFLGQGEMPLPGMKACGVDPTEDDVSCDEKPAICEK